MEAAEDLADFRKTTKAAEEVAVGLVADSEAAIAVTVEAVDATTTIAEPDEAITKIVVAVVRKEAAAVDRRRRIKWTKKVFRRWLKLCRATSFFEWANKKFFLN